MGAIHLPRNCKDITVRARTPVFSLTSIWSVRHARGLRSRSTPGSLLLHSKCSLRRLLPAPPPSLSTRTILTHPCPTSAREALPLSANADSRASPVRRRHLRTLRPPDPGRRGPCAPGPRYPPEKGYKTLARFKVDRWKPTLMSMLISRPPSIRQLGHSLQNSKNVPLTWQV